MATRTLESRFERMSVNDENDPGDGTKYQKSKVHNDKYIRNMTVILTQLAHLNCFEFPIIPKFWSSQPLEDRITKSKHNKYDCYRAFPGGTMARVKYAQWIGFASPENDL